MLEDGSERGSEGKISCEVVRGKAPREQETDPTHLRNFSRKPASCRCRTPEEGTKICGGISEMKGAGRITLGPPPPPSPFPRRRIARLRLSSSTRGASPASCSFSTSGVLYYSRLYSAGVQPCRKFGPQSLERCIRSRSPSRQAASSGGRGDSFVGLAGSLPMLHPFGNS